MTVWHLPCPGFSTYDADVAEVVSYVRNSWTNQAPKIDVNDVALFSPKAKTSTDIAPDLSIDAAEKGANQ